jgi:hypothetical protein
MLSCQKITRASSRSLPFYSHFFHPSSITVTRIQSVFKQKLFLGSHYFSFFSTVQYDLASNQQSESILTVVRCKNCHSLLPSVRKATTQTVPHRHNNFYQSCALHIPCRSSLFRSYGCVCWWIVTDVLEQPIGPTFKQQAVREEFSFCTSKMEATGRPRTPLTKYQSVLGRPRTPLTKYQSTLGRPRTPLNTNLRCATSRESADLISTVAEV